MSEFRRKLMSINTSSVKPASSYIQQDLIFQLDGLEKGNNAGKWTDLINGYVFQGNATELENGWDFNGAHKLECVGVLGISQLTENFTWTVELAFHLKNPSRWGMLFSTNWHYGSGRSKNICTKYSATNSWVCLDCGTSSKHDRIDLNGYSVNKNSDITWSTFCNGTTSVLNCNLTQYNFKNGNTLGANDRLIIGNRETSANGDAYAIIYAIRVYNRQLTTSEMQYNQRLDIERFNLNIS